MCKMNVRPFGVRTDSWKRVSIHYIAAARVVGPRDWTRREEEPWRREDGDKIISAACRPRALGETREGQTQLGCVRQPHSLFHDSSLQCSNLYRSDTISPREAGVLGGSAMFPNVEIEERVAIAYMLPTFGGARAF